MRGIAHLIFAGLVIAAAAYVQQGGFLTVSGITPNLLLIAFVVLIVRGERWTPLLLLLAGFIAYGAVREPFWLGEYAVFASIVIVMRAVRGRLTGSATADFFILIAGGSFLLHGTHALLRVSAFSVSAIAWDLVYTVGLGAVLWFCTAIYGKKTNSI